jgi:D-glycero-alpha-D-manno-heptose 1-phosphate guanylyltransferase
MGEAVREVLGQRQHGMELVYSHEETPLDTGGALRLALPYLEGSEVLVLNGDSFLDADLSPMITPLSSPPPCLLAAANLMDTSRFGRLLLTDTHEVTAFLEKGLAGPGYINAGIYRFKRATLATIPPDRPVSLEREFFPDMIGKGLYARPLSGAFVDIGTPESFTMAEEFFHDFAG